MATQFILLADAPKYADRLTTAHPFVVEAVPDVTGKLINSLNTTFEIENILVRKDAGQQPVLTKRGAVLLDVYFKTLPDLAELNSIKMWPGIIDHSLFYQMATAAIVCGPQGTAFDRMSCLVKNCTIAFEDANFESKYDFLIRVFTSDCSNIDSIKSINKQK